MRGAPRTLGLIPPPPPCRRRVAVGGDEDGPAGRNLLILDLHRQGLSVTAVAQRTGRDPKTKRKYIERGLEPPAYGPRQAGRPSKLAPYLAYLRERVAAFPDLSAVRLTRELRERGYTGAYTAVKRFIAAIGPPEAKPYEVRFETPSASRPRAVSVWAESAGGGSPGD